MPTRRHYIKQLYQQLRKCGRSTGDSWYSVEKIYSTWQHFSAECWVELEARIRRSAVHVRGETYYLGHEKEMLEHLRPGADCRKFLPRA